MSGDGSLFSKSMNNFDTDGNSGLLDVRKDATSLIVDIVRRSDGTLTTFIFSESFAEASWQHIGLIIDYDPVSFATSVTVVINATSKPVISESGAVLLDTPDSLTLLGARFDAGENGQTITNILTGFIYSINITPSTLSVEQITSGTSYTCSEDFCSICPVSGNCLWECEIDELFDGTSCVSCPTCEDPHVNAWDGCVDEVDCNLCYNKLCTTCSDFS